MLYDAKYAQQQYEQMLSESRKGISLTEQELDRINNTITPLLKKDSHFLLSVNITGMNCQYQTGPSIPMSMQVFWMPEI